MRTEGTLRSLEYRRGFERGNRNEFHQFLSIAKSSAAEVRSDLYTALDIGYLEEEGFTLLLGEGEEVACIIGGLRRAVSPPRTTR
ncbi:MAG TPA: four helix bundle protein [Thermoanaerobaculia bacterium]|nr:four helix bundle protein [Thermoanaerobaculia bacterium]